MRYAAVIEKAARNYSAYLPDVPGCVATGKTVAETLNNLREALQMHFEALQGQGEPIPDPQALVDYIDASTGLSGPSRGKAPAKAGSSGRGGRVNVSPNVLSGRSVGTAKPKLPQATRTPSPSRA